MQQTATVERHIPRASARRPLGRSYACLWGATAVSNLGDGLRYTALPLLAAALTRDPVSVAGIVIASNAPWLLFSVIGGAIIDRVDRRRLALRVSVLRGLVVLGLGLAVITGSASITLIYAIAFLQGLGEVFSDNAAFAMLSSVVDSANLKRANGRLEAGLVVANDFAGPALGAYLFTLAAALPFLVDGLSFAVAGVLFLGIPSSGPAAQTDSTSKRRLWLDIREGVQWLWFRPTLRNLSIMAALTNLALQATFSIVVLYALEIHDLSESGFGLLISIAGVGGLLGAIVAPRFAEKTGLRVIVFGTLFTAAVANLVIGAAGSIVLVGAMMTVVFACGSTWNVVTNSFRQAQVPDRLLGRVQGAHRLLSWGCIPVGSLLGGVLGRVVGLQAPYIAASGLLLALAFSAPWALRNRD